MKFMEPAVSVGRSVVYLEVEIVPPIWLMHLWNFPFKFPANMILIKTNEVSALALGPVGLVLIKMH